MSSGLLQSTRMSHIVMDHPFHDIITQFKQPHWPISRRRKIFKTLSEVKHFIQSNYFMIYSPQSITIKTIFIVIQKPKWASFLPLYWLHLSGAILWRSNGGMYYYLIQDMMLLALSEIVWALNNETFPLSLLQISDSKPVYPGRQYLRRIFISFCFPHGKVLNSWSIQNLQIKACVGFEKYLWFLTW
jgi:hypothetical protein